MQRLLVIALLGSVCACVSACGCSDEPPTGDDPIQEVTVSTEVVYFPISVSRYASVVVGPEQGGDGDDEGATPDSGGSTAECDDAGEVLFSDSDAVDALAGATAVLQLDHDGSGSEDVACMVEFKLEGSVTTFDDEACGYIYTQEDWRRVVNRPSCVKVVKGIWACGSHVHSGAGEATWVGCGQTALNDGADGQKFLVLKEFEYDWWGRLWAHEFGHTQGIASHESHHRALMYKSIGEASERVSPGTCESFRKKRHENACATTSASTGGNPDGNQVQGDDLTSVGGGG